MPRRRDRPFRRDLFLARSTVLPPKYCAKDEHHEVDPSDHHPLAKRDVDAPPLPSLPLVTNLQELLRIVRDDPVEFLLDAPPHHVRLVDRPHVQRAPLGFGVADEARAEDGEHEGLLQHVEGDVGDREELARVRDGEADVRDGEGGQVFGAEGEVLDGPAAEDDALVPGFEGIRRHGSDGFGDEAHHFVGVVVELYGFWSVSRDVMGFERQMVRRTLISNRSQTFSSPGDARNSSRSFNRGMGS